MSLEGFRGQDLFGGCFGCRTIFMLGEKYTVQTAERLTTVLLLEAPEEPGLSFPSRCLCLTDKAIFLAATPI